jgi:hypothetical protein
MNAVVSDAIAAELALLTQLVPTPVAPFGFGVDTDGVLDVTDTLDEVPANSPVGISQALARRYQTPRGTLPTDLTYGRDVRAYINRGMTLADVREIEGELRGEALKDDRIDEVQVTVTLVGLSELRINVLVTPADPVTGGPFSLTLAATPSSVLVEAINVLA